MWGAPAVSKSVSYPPYNFSWIEQNKLAAMACPSSEANYQFLRDQGIHHILTLSPENVPTKLKYWDLGWSRIDVQEFEAPSLENILEFLDLCQKCRMRKQAIAIHCRMGRGRTGVMAACYLVHFMKIAPERAITNIRLMRPGSIETYEQERSVVKFHDYIRTIEDDFQPNYETKHITQ
ncbi:dual specificity protein phosphatase 23-like [Coccinella septempunctata]|uniref:dual specificity protein phosphatase 23-like n=1 Tax=Coccinella septempunctata TaxID=41139 RepID=UPI001D062B45|nr:dual specificity protein phosphatase 23-like [Coccinella septempunctata]